MDEGRKRVLAICRGNLSCSSPEDNKTWAEEGQQAAFSLAFGFWNNIKTFAEVGVFRGIMSEGVALPRKRHLVSIRDYGCRLSITLSTTGKAPYWRGVQRLEWVAEIRSLWPTQLWSATFCLHVRPKVGHPDERVW